MSLEELLSDVDAAAHDATTGKVDPADAVAHIAEVLDLYRADRYERDTDEEIRSLPEYVEGWSCTGRRAA